MVGKRGRNTAVVLAAGTGSRMGSKVAKQFMTLGGKPLIYYALRAMEKSQVIHDVILVTAEDDMEKMRAQVVEKYGFRKVRTIIPGGSERCYSVANAMRWINAVTNESRDVRHLVFIHDGARPFVTEEILERTCEAAMECGACVAAMPSKDTVKIADEASFAAQTPDRGTVWMVQTPQVFDRTLIVQAYREFENAMAESGAKGEVPAGKAPVTDDASVVEMFTDVKVKLVEGAYTNLKVTTPEDMVIAEALLAQNLL